MEDILASIKRVIAEEKDVRSVRLDAQTEADDQDGDVLELDHPLGEVSEPPLLDDGAAGHSRQALEQLQSVAAAAPAAVNPLEDLVREMLRPMLKQWLDDHLSAMIDEHVKREISRITGRPL